MGEVYRARDSKLGREVAIKVLPAELARDAERLSRLQREARVLASLNHPSVATLHGFEQDGDTHFLVMELVAGETLADRIARGAIPVSEAIALFLQIAQALEAAHEKGVVHRDLKPANVKVTGTPSTRAGADAGADGSRVKLLDFGVAKAMEMTAAAAGVNESPTLTAGPTRAGILLGTPAYMSPQQAQGLPADKRSDIWAYGVCLYEALTGSRPFGGDNASMTMAAVLTAAPDLGRVDARLRRVVARCLEKNPARRYHDIADVRLDLEAVGKNDVDATAHDAETRPRSGSREKVAWGAAFLAVAVAAWSIATRSQAPPVRALAPTTRLSIPVPNLMPEEAFGVAISPDGQRVVYVGEIDGRRWLMRRDLDALEATPIPGTQDSWGFQYFSPDGKWLAHMSGASVLQKLPLEGGRSVDLADALLWGGGDWASDGTLVVGNTEDLRIYRLSDAGGDLIPLTTVQEGETSHSLPAFLPGEQAFAFTVRRRDGIRAIAVQRLGETEHTVLLEGDSPTFLSEYLVFWRGSGLWAIRFDAQALKIVGEAVPLVDEPLAPRGFAVFGGSRSGSLVYTPRSAGIRGLLVWLDRAGRETPIGLPAGDYMHPRVGPDGRRIAFVSIDGSEGFGRRGRGDVLLLDENSLQPRVILSDPVGSESPLWSPDGQRLVFRGLLQAREIIRLYDQSRVRDVGLPNADTVTPSGWTKDGLVLASFNRPKTLGDLFTVNLETGEATELLATAADESLPVLSPDGRWLAYQDAEAVGEDKILIRPFPRVDAGGPWLVAAGTCPSWNPDGHELFFVREEALWSVRMGPEPPFVQGDPVLLLKGPYFETPFYSRPYDYDPHADRFLVVRHERARRSLVVVQNLAAELERRFAGQRP